MNDIRHFLFFLQYFVIGLNNTDEIHGCQKQKAVYDYTKWILTSSKASQSAKSLQFATMPEEVAQEAVKILDQMNCTYS